jgi:tripeptidyl-peptidase-1
MNFTAFFGFQSTDDGTVAETSPLTNLEANIDVQYTIGLATGVPVDFISAGNDADDEDLDELIDTINDFASHPATSTVISTSYALDEEELSQLLAEKLCDAYAALGAQGVSVIFASGDGGVAGSGSDECTAFVPTFPASCP